MANNKNKYTTIFFFLVFFILFLIPSGLALGEDGAIYSVTIFALLLPITLFIVAVQTERFFDHPITDLLARRAIIAFSLMLMVYNTSLMMSLANFASLGITKQLGMFTFIYAWGSIVMIIFLVIKTILDWILLAKDMAKTKRMGGEDDEEGGY